MAKTKDTEVNKDSSESKTATAVQETEVKTVKRPKSIPRGRVYINASYNNTVVSVTDDKGNVLAWATAGGIGFSGPKKATPFAASKIISVVTEKLKGLQIVEVDVIVKGVGGGRDSAIRSLINQGFNVVSIKDMTPVPHNGPRPPKVRRV
jgi:small subunit ribosomal protein S11